MERRYKMGFDEKIFKFIYKNIIKLLNKTSNFTINGLEKYMKIQYSAKKIELQDINLIMKKGYKLYHRNSCTPLLISEEMILEQDYYATYLIYSNITDLPSKKDSMYVHTAYIIGSKDKIHADSFCIFNGNREITDSLEILCNNTLDDIKKRHL